MDVGVIGARKECSKFVYSDASSTGFGGYLVDTGEGIVQPEFYMAWIKGGWFSP